MTARRELTFHFHFASENCDLGEKNPNRYICPLFTFIQVLSSKKQNFLLHGSSWFLNRNLFSGGKALFTLAMPRLARNCEEDLLCAPWVQP